MQLNVWLIGSCETEGKAGTRHPYREENILIPLLLFRLVMATIGQYGAGMHNFYCIVSEMISIVIASQNPEHLTFLIPLHPPATLFAITSNFFLLRKLEDRGRLCCENEYSKLLITSPHRIN